MEDTEPRPSTSPKEVDGEIVEVLEKMGGVGL